MSWGLLGAFAATVAYGIATVLQAIGVREGDAPNQLDARLVSRLLNSAKWLLGLLLDAVGFVLSFAALRTLPLFTVQAIVASSLAVTALLAVMFLGARLRPREWVALLAITAGLALLASSAAKQHAVKLSTLDRSLLVTSIAVVGVLAFVAARGRPRPSRSDGWAFGALAGLMYGAGGIAARVLRHPKPLWSVFDDPALYSLALAGILGLLLYAMALQRGTVTVATAAVVVAETVVPAVVGVALLGDRPAAGGAVLAGFGFVLSVSGAVALARYGEPPTRSRDAVADVGAACPN